MSGEKIDTNKMIKNKHTNNVIIIIEHNLFTWSTSLSFIIVYNVIININIKQYDNKQNKTGNVFIISYINESISSFSWTENNSNTNLLI